MTYILLLKIDTLYIFWDPKSDGQGLTTEVLWQFVENFQLQIEFSIFLLGRESWIELDRQHVEGAFELILHGDTLSEWRRKLKTFHLHQLVIIDGVLYLGNSDLVFIIV